jgi:prevent-host-death family protein
MIRLSDIHSVTDFQRKTKDHLKRLEKSRRPIVLTLNGKAKAVVLDAQSCEDLMEKAEQTMTSPLRVLRELPVLRRPRTPVLRDRRAD